jgi:hypothetical protein
MNDPLEEELIRSYRALDPAARRLEGRTRPRTRRVPIVRRPALGPWIGAGVAAAAAILVIAFATLHRPTTAAREPETVHREPSTVTSRAPIVPPPTPTSAPPVPPSSEPPPTPTTSGSIAPPPQGTSQQAPPPPPPTTSESQPPRPPTQPAAVAKFTIDEVTGGWTLNGKSQRAAKKIELARGDTLAADTTVKIVLAENRFLLLAPKSAIVVEPEETRLAIRIEKGEMLAELIGRGLPLRVLTAACTLDPLGTVFDVRVEGNRTHVIVEEGAVDAGGVIVKPGRSLTAVAGQPLPPTGEADMRRLAWARAHRPAERILFEETFDQAGEWQADVVKGVARGIGSRSSIELKRKDPPIFRVPVKGRIVIVMRAERAAELALQIHQAEPKMNFRLDQPVRSGSGWQTVVVEIDRIPPNTQPKTEGAPEPGAAVDNLLLLYGRDGEKLGFWVDSIRVVEVRP